MTVRVAVAPDDVGRAARDLPSSAEARRKRILATVREAGGEVTPPAEASALIWLAIGDPQPLSDLLDAHRQIRWVQLPWAGVDSFSGSDLLDRDVVFTCAKEAYAGQVAEHALMLILTSLRDVTRHARTREWRPTEPRSLEGQRVTILGGGGIAERLLVLLQPAGCRVTVVRRSDRPLAGAHRTVSTSALHDVLPETDVLVLALALTPETRGLVGAQELALLPDGAVLVNVARGAHVDTDALVAALREGRLASAGLDVTDPEPLPADHPLWAMDNVLVTSHCANSTEYATEKLAERVRENLRRFPAGDPLLGVVDPVAGY